MSIDKKLLSAMDIGIGKEIAIVPAGVSGAGFQGKLEYVIFKDDLPWAFVILGNDDQKLTVFAHAAQMIYSPQPKVELAPEVEAALVADFEAAIAEIDKQFPVPVED